jgi:purine nucleosidase
MDYNMQVDARSALSVLQSSSPTLVPLSVTAETALRRAYLTPLRQAGPLAQLIARQVEVQGEAENNEALYGRTCAGLPDDILNFQHDPLTCAIALGWRDGVEIKELFLTSEIKDGWLCQRIDERGKPIRVVTRVAGNEFNEFWLKTVTG